MKCEAHDELTAKIAHVEGVSDRIIAALDEIRASLARLEERIYSTHGELADARATQRAGARALAIAVAIGAAVGSLVSAGAALLAGRL